MTRNLTMIALSVSMLVSAHAVAADARAPPTISKHQTFVQIVNCMKKRMSTHKDLSYNAAEKACKGQVDSGNDDSEPVARVASDSSAKP
jgi:hypothetical protein